MRLAILVLCGLAATGLRAALPDRPGPAPRPPPDDAAAGPAEHSYGLPVAAVRTLPVLPVPVDNAEAWLLSQPPAIPLFLQPFTGEPALPAQTEVRIACDRQQLYFHFTCRGSPSAGAGGAFPVRLPPPSADARDDDSIGAAECVEVFLQPPDAPEPYFHLMVNRNGQRLDERGRDRNAWNGSWTYRVRQESPESWTALILIPFRDLGVAPPAPGTRWKANFGRNNPPPGGLSGWSVLPDLSLHRTECFGELVFSGAGVPAVSLSGITIDHPGEHRVVARLFNPETTPRWVYAELGVDQGVQARFYRELPPGESSWDLDLPVWQYGRHRMHVAVCGAGDGRVLYRTPDLPLDLPPYLARLAEYRALLETAAAAPPEAKKRLEQSLEKVTDFARSGDPHAERWQELGEKIDQLEPALLQLRYQAADPGRTGYVLLPETSLRKLLRTGPPAAAEPGKALRLQAARREFESGQAVVAAYGQALEGVAVSVTDLTGPDGARLDAVCVSLNPVGYVKTRKPAYPAPEPDWYPDPLLPPGAFAVPQGRLQPVWVTVETPAACPPGVYRGEIVVTPANAPERRLPLEVEVWDFTLPVEMHLRTAFALDEKELGDWYGEVTPALRRRFYECMLRYRLNPGSIYAKEPTPGRADFSWCAEQGMSLINLGYLGPMDPKRTEAYLQMVAKWRDGLKDPGWWRRAYVYGFDEATPEEYGKLRTAASRVKLAFPDLPVMSTVAPNQELRGYVDIWVPLTAFYDAEKARGVVRAGDQVWWYVCCYPWAPYANWFIDYPAPPARLLFWMNWKYQVPGVLYYAVNMWRSNRQVDGLPAFLQPPENPADCEAIRRGKRWPEVPWNTFSCLTFNGDGLLIYPGPDRTPVASIRLACIRDGIEDYEYFWQLDQLVRQAKTAGVVLPAPLAEQADRLLAVPPDVVASMTTYTHDPARILATRRQLAETIVALRRLVHPPEPPPAPAPAPKILSFLDSLPIPRIPFLK